jgi:hypothetical protein
VSRSKHESDYLGRVKSLDCVLCSLLGQAQEGVTEAHHIRTGHGLGDRASDFLTVALCVECHRGTHGFHGTKALMRIAKLSELDLLAETIRQMDEKGGESKLTPLKGITPTDSRQENAVAPEGIRPDQSIQPDVPRRRSRRVQSSRTSPA